MFSDLSLALHDLPPRLTSIDIDGPTCQSDEMANPEPANLKIGKFIGHPSPWDPCQIYRREMMERLVF